MCGGLDLINSGTEDIIDITNNPAAMNSCPSGGKLLFNLLELIQSKDTVASNTISLNFSAI